MGPRPRRRPSADEPIDESSGHAPYKGRHCHACEGMPWRRPHVGRCRCGGVHAEDPVLAQVRNAIRKAVA